MPKGATSREWSFPTCHLWLEKKEQQTPATPPPKPWTQRLSLQEDITAFFGPLSLLQVPPDPALHCSGLVCASLRTGVGSSRFSIHTCRIKLICPFVQNSLDIDGMGWVPGPRFDLKQESWFSHYKSFVGKLGEDQEVAEEVSTLKQSNWHFRAISNCVSPETSCRGGGRAEIISFIVLPFHGHQTGTLWATSQLSMSCWSIKLSWILIISRAHFSSLNLISFSYTFFPC